jgi:hypothetical protein
MGEIIDLEGFRAKGGVAHDVARDEQDGQILADGLKLLNASMSEAIDNSLLLTVTLVGLISGYRNWSALRDGLSEDLEFEIEESLRFVRAVWLVQLRKNISAVEGLLERFTTGTKVPIPSII